MIKRIIIAGILLESIFSVAHGQVTYPYAFNPERGIVSSYEEPYREEVCLNGTWQFMPVFSRDTNDLRLQEKFKWSDIPIRIPSPWNVNAFAKYKDDDFVTFPGYPPIWNNAPIGWMRKEFTVPSGWKGKRIFLHFEAVAGKAVYYLNGKKVGDNFDIFFPYEMDITHMVKPGSKNELLVGVAAPALFDHRGKYGRRTYVAGSFWGTTIRGIWQDVYLLARPETYISNVYIRPDVSAHTLSINVTIKNESSRSQKIRIDGIIRKWKSLAGNSVNEAPVQKDTLGAPVLRLEQPAAIVLPAHTTDTITLRKTINGALSYWTPQTPNLYGVVLSVKKGKKVLDKKYERFGWRQFSIVKDTLLLNGTPIQLKGDSWHFMGVPEMTRRYAWAWFKMLKAANGNAVRLHAQPYPSFFLDVADEMGICVLDESGIWASDGGPKMDSKLFWQSCKVHLTHLVLRDRNHPSVFGWSVSNETIPVAVNVFHAPDSIVHHLLAEINSWVALVRKLDPTRQWISGDGETQLPTELPTVVGHYGGEEGMRQWSSEGKPWGIGEQGMAYYGTPRQVSAINGNRAYVSQEGRMEGLATEAFGLIKAQRKLNASYSSIFNVVWYGLKPLALGMKNTGRSIQPDDGIFFSSFREGVPGMQPERLPPYSTTLNPGYDPSLPLYEPWPLFYAVKAAFADPIQPFEISRDSVAVPVTLENFNPSHRKVLLLSSGNSPLLDRLKMLGIDTVTGRDDPRHTLILIDGSMPPVSQEAVNRIRAVAAAGGMVFIAGVSSGSIARLNKLLLVPVSLTDRQATSFIKEVNCPVLSGLGNSDFYFTELIRRPVMQYGLSGEFVKKGTTLLAACNTDWSRWNSQPEYYKTGAVWRSERELKEPGNALVRYVEGNGTFYIMSLALDSMGSRADGLMWQMLSNLGATFSHSSREDQSSITTDGFLKRALVCGTFDANGMNPVQIKEHDFLGDEMTVNPHEGERSDGKFWMIDEADGAHLFSFYKMPMSGPRSNAVAYLSFWLYSPRSLVNLLVEPDMPSLDLDVNTDGNAEIFLNGKAMSGMSVKNVPLIKGWNHFLIKAIQQHRGRRWTLGIHFSSDHADFIKKMQSSVMN